MESARPRSAGGSERAAEAGLCITSFDFSPRHSSIFVVGTLCGGIYKCSLDSVTAIEGSRLVAQRNKIFHRKQRSLSISGDSTLIDPVIDEYERHGGSVTCIKCSPLRNLFVSSATDKEIRIYNLDEVNLCTLHFGLSNNDDSDSAEIGILFRISLFILIEFFFVNAIFELKNKRHGRTINYIMY